MEKNEREDEEIMGDYIGKKVILYYNGNMKPMKWNKEKNLKPIIPSRKKTKKYLKKKEE